MTSNANVTSHHGRCSTTPVPDRRPTLLEEPLYEIRVVGLSALRPEMPRTVSACGHQAEEPVLLAFHAHRELETLVDVLAGGLLVLPEVEELLESSCHDPAVPVEEQAARLAGILVPTLVLERVTLKLQAYTSVSP